MKRLAHPTLSVELSPYPMTLHLFTKPATYCRAIKNYQPSDKLSPKDIKRGGACSVFNDHILVGVFYGGAETLVHELTHALEHVVEHVELPRGFDHNEPAAYLMAHMYRACVGAIGA